MPDPSPILDANLALLAKQMRFNPLRGITPASLTNALDQFDAGYLRWAVLAWEEMCERDDKLVIAVPKMIRRVASRPWDVLIGEEVPEGQMAEAEAQQKELKYFYSNLRCKDVLEKNKTGQLKMLISAIMKAPLHRYAPPVGLEWKPSSKGMGCTAHIAPLQLFENTQGELRFAGVEYRAPGVALGDPQNWLIAVADTCLMKALSICYMFKRLPLTDALNFCQRFGIPGIHGETAATKGTPEWADFIAALRAYANDAVIATAVGAKINLLETAAADGEAVFGWIIEAMNRAMVTICLGSDLATMSREDGTGASLQGEDADDLTAAFCDFVSEVFREQLDRRVIEWAFGEGTEPLAFFSLIPPQNEDTKLQMQIDDHVTKYGVKLSVDDIAERYGRTHDEDAAEVEALEAEVIEDRPRLQAANDATLATLRRRGEAAFIAGARQDLQPLIDSLLPLVNAQGADATRNAAQILAQDLERMESAVLEGGASTTALEVAFATELLRGLAAPGELDDSEADADADADAANDNPYHDERGRFTDAARARSVRTRTKKDAFGMLPVEGISPADNLARGNRAIQWMLKNKRDVRNFMHRPELGTIELDWGMPGVADRDYLGGYGLSHILAKHGRADALKLPQALIHGELTMSTTEPDKRLINLGSYKTILVKHKKRSAWILTGYTMS
ncbi:MAG: phage portal protein family protein [Prosthecobacter sp.]